MPMTIPVQIDIDDLPEEMLDEIEKNFWSCLMAMPITKEGNVTIFSKSDKETHQYTFNLIKEIEDALRETLCQSEAQIAESLRTCERMMALFSYLTDRADERREELLSMLGGQDA